MPDENAYETVDLRIEERVAWLTLNRPDKLNALTPTTMTELRDIFTRVDDDEDVCVVVLRGAMSARSAPGWTWPGRRS